MELFELVEYLRKQKILLDVIDGKLSISGDESNLTPALIEEIKKFKTPLSAYIKYKNSNEIVQGDDGDSGPFPLSFAQRRLFFLYQYEPLTTHFNIPVHLSLSDNFVEASFKNALSSLVQRHIILGATYSIIDGTAVQSYDKTRAMDYEYLDLSEQAEGVVRDTCESIIDNVCLSPFDLQNELPLKVRLVKLPEQTYSLYLVFHHIATDQWSIKIFMDELRALYNNFNTDHQKSFAPVSLSYFDFAKWQNEHHKNGCYEVAKSYWKNYYSGVTGFLQLPLDHERPATQKFTNGFISRTIPKHLTTKVAHYLGNRSVSEYSFFLSVFNILLSKLCNDSDIVVGVDVFGRNHQDLNNIQGFFINQIALRSKINHDLLFDDYLEGVHSDTLDCFAYQDMPFDLVVESLELERSTAYSPLYQVKYLYDVSDQTLDLFEGVAVTEESTFEIQSQYDITLKVINGEIHAFYNKHLFSASTIESWLDYFISISEEVLVNPKIRLADTLQYKLAKDLVDTIESKTVALPETNIIQRIETSALTCSDDIAITTDTENLTYKQLIQKVNSVAAHLIDMGVAKGMNVGIHMDRSADYIIALLAIMKTGAAFMPLDPEYPEEHIDYMLENSGATLIISNEKYNTYLTGFYGVILEIESLIHYEQSLDEVNFPVIDNDDAAYLLYTSGSTGQPKGILIRQQSLNNLCCWYADFSNLHQSSTCLLMIAIGFDASIKEILTPLMKGAQLVVAKADFFDPDYLLNLINSHSVQHVNTVPSAAYTLLKQDESNDYQRLKSIKFFAVGGEPMNLSLFKPWFNSESCHAKLANLYGPTECTDISVAYVNDKQGYLALENVPIGRPIYNAEARIVDKNMKLCPIGVLGELIISGQGVGIGYQHNEQETAKRFIDSDFSSSKVYRTGDFCKYDKDGNIVYIGRQDGQIKIRGKRVEVSQITFHLSQLLPDRRSVVQLYRTDAIETLVAFIEGAKCSFQSNEIQAYLTQKLPLYMVPSTVLFVEDFPFLSNGKTDNKALEITYQQRKNDSSTFIEHDFNELEKNIADVWCDVLAINQIDPQDNFFSIGGDSILSIQVVSELKKRGLECSVYDIFKHPTFHLFANFLSNASPVENSNSEPQFVAPFSLINEDDRLLITEEFEDAYPLTRLQQGMLFDRDFQQSTSLYHDIFAFEIQFKYVFEQSCFVQSINKVINCHPLLRTAFDTQSYSQPLQLVRKISVSNVIEHDICDLTPSQQQDFINAELKQIKARKLDLLHDSLINFMIITVSKNSIVFINDAHHAILDGWSNALLNRQIYDNYKNLRQKETASKAITGLKANFAAYVAKEYNQLNNPNNKAYWQSYLKDDYCGKIAERQPLCSASSRAETFNVSEKLVSSLELICSQYHLPVKQVFHAAHFYVLSFITGNRRLFTGIVDNGRFESADGEKVVGLFLNTLPVRADLTDHSWLELATSLDETLVEHKAFRDFPYSEMVNLNPNLKLDSLFNFINFHILDAIKDENELDLSVYGELFEETSFKFTTTVNGNFEDGFLLSLRLGWAVPESYLKVVNKLFSAALHQMTADFEQKIGGFNSLVINDNKLNPQTNAQQLPQIIKIRGDFEPDHFAAVIDFTLCKYNSENIDAVITRYPFDIEDGVKVDEEQIVNELMGGYNTIVSTEGPYVAWIQSSDCYYLALNIKLDDQQSLNQFYCKLLDVYHMTVEQQESSNIYYSLLVNEQNEKQMNWLSLAAIKTQLGHLKYWKTQLTEIPVVHSIPLDYSRPEIKTKQGAVVTSQLDTDLTQRLNQVASETQLTPFMLLHGALALVLSRHSNSQDIVIGMAQAELKPLIGLFDNTLVLRVDTNHEKLTDYFTHIKTINADAQAHQDIPFEQLVEHCNVPRSKQHTPLFQITFTMNTHEQSELTIPGVSFTPIEDSKVVANFDLEISAQMTESEIYFSWVYDTSLFSQAHIETISAHLNRLLAGMLAAPAAKLCDLPMLSAQEIHYLTHELNNTQVDHPQDKLIHELFEEQAKSNPDNIAVVFEEQQLTYKELNEASNQLAYYLREQGVETETLVGLCVERSLEMVIGILAILKTGGAYVPLDPDHPEARLNYMLEDTGLKHLLTQTAITGTFSVADNVQVTTLDSDSFIQFLQNYDKENLELSATQHSSNLAYIIYTSGSTGKPKGVMMEHQGLFNRIDWMQKAYQLDVTDRVLQKTSYCFDVSVWEFVWTLGYGARLIMAKPGGQKDPEYLQALIQQEQVSVIHFVPSMLSAYLATPLTEFPESLRYVFCSGEALQVSDVKFMQERAPHISLLNLYGPTEAAIDVSYFDCQALTDQRVVPIGKPIQNIELIVLDKQLNCCPMGSVGELHIGGVGLARGYLNQPELTGERFIQSPFSNNTSDNTNDRLYKTGDLVRYLPDGDLEFIGRIDNQVKIRGFRIELGEIESQLSQNEDVAASLVFVREDELGEKRLVAYVVAKEKEGLDEVIFINSLRGSLQQTLPDYMLPSAFVLLAHFPLTPNGKVDKKALPTPDASLLQGEYVAPANDTEIELVSIWANLLKIDADIISVNANFFDLGGHSLLAVRLVSEISNKLHQELAIKVTFEYSTVRSLAEVIDSAKARLDAIKTIEETDSVFELEI